MVSDNKDATRHPNYKPNWPQSSSRYGNIDAGTGAVCGADGGAGTGAFGGTDGGAGTGAVGGADSGAGTGAVMV